MAFLVALVPTTVDTKCGTKYADVVADANTADAVRNNVLTLLLASLIGVGLHRLMPRSLPSSRSRTSSKTSLTESPR